MVALPGMLYLITLRLAMLRFCSATLRDKLLHGLDGPDQNMRNGVARKRDVAVYAMLWLQATMSSLTSSSSTSFGRLNPSPALSLPSVVARLAGLLPLRLRPTLPPSPLACLLW
ncbi:hypothetical protein VTK73DRAFT_5854 [Phialemonium thermophilum]|uniref:Secreted protein n=1 Tax=Phialemonium thermophilum TaxID=223376 RepID=A0ABR3V0K9_9PEZI